MLSEAGVTQIRRLPFQGPNQSASWRGGSLNRPARLTVPPTSMVRSVIRGWF